MTIMDLCPSKRAVALALPLLGCLLVPMHSVADQLIADDLVLTGKLCTGFDCLIGGAENFGDSSVKLKENNTQIRLYNTASQDVLAKAWVLSANDSSNGGPSRFSFMAMSFDKDTIKRSDGQHRAYDCEEGDVVQPFPNAPELLNTLIPYGEPLIVPSGNICSTLPWFTEDTVLRLSATAEDSVTIGSGSMPVPGSVSVGTLDSLRKLKHVAQPTGPTDVLTVGAIEDHSVLQGRKDQLNQLKSQIALVKTRLTQLENGDRDGDGILNKDDPFPKSRTNFESGSTVLTLTPLSPSSTCTIAASTATAVTSENRPVGVVSLKEVDFTLTNCSPSESLEVTVDFGQEFPPGAVAYKVVSGIWTPIAGARIEGSKVSYTLVNNGELDTDPSDSVISDPVAVVSPLIPIPVLPRWLLLVLAISLALMASRRFIRH
ncbi:choice-of-anchor U domain-containing protein [Candidatus Nitrotoga sp. M5]|uniref:choice-of-anchor U domain-containing protein n=1 Tax=Candidatus Nitrotoga sp. M5 TaxID=2890409 RepID=UPI001EF194A6|nr:choice-of-anchor U domain-containing protein [Candidatus Nitrotoga sp. M5]CAH1385410.1 conserved exported hypothetical protein [Candidatus Nitrotoga sp. M5]